MGLKEQCTLSGGDDMDTSNKNAPADALSLELLVNRLEDKDSIINGISDAVMLLDAKSYRILDANKAFLDSYKLNYEEFFGKTCHKITHHQNKPCSEVLPGTACPLELAISTGNMSRVEHVHADSRGKRRYFELTAYPVRAANGDITRIVHIGKDITDRKLAEEALRANEEKTRLFAYSIAHDLKGPAIVIHGLAQRFCRSHALNLDKKDKDFCTHIVGASEQIVSLLESIQTFISAKEVPLTPNKMNLREVLQEIRREFFPELNARKIKWHEPDIDPEINADRLSLIRVLRNLVDNALKYGGDNLGEIRVGYKESGDSHIIYVTDNGVGLGKDSLARVFLPFERDLSGRKVYGSGLGLAIVGEIARQHGGEAWAESEMGAGATFFVRIPKEPHTSEAAADTRD